MKKLHLALGVLLCLITVHIGYAQTKKITGTVTSASDGSAIPGVNIMVKSNPTIGTATDIDGKFEIHLPASAEVLIVSSIGMEQQEITIGTQTHYTIIMKEAATKLDEVMVVAYGTAKKETYTGSAEVIKQEEITKTSSNTVSKALLGKVAGVQVASSSAAAGSGAAIRIRGIGSATASSDPLYVVDGVQGAPVPNNNDIASVTVLKDAAAASLYGSRAANGVIIITTKKGEGNLNFNVKYQNGLSWRSPSKFELMGSNEYMAKAWEGLYNRAYYLQGMSAEQAAQYAHSNLKNTTGGYIPYGEKNEQGKYVEMGQPFADDGSLLPSAKLMYETNWQDQIYRTGKTNDLHISASKGDEKTSLYTSFSYYDQEGILIGNNYNKLELNINTSSKVNDYFEYGVNTNLSYYKGRSNRSLWDVYTMNPAAPLYELDNNFNPILDADGNKIYHWNTIYYDLERNPLAEVDKYDEGYDGRTLFAAPFVKITPLKGLSITARGSAKYNYQKGSYFYFPVHGGAKDENGRSTRNNWDNSTYTGLALATYQKKLGKHEFKLSAGYEAESYEYNFVYGSTTGFSMWEIASELNNGEVKDEIKSGITEATRQSVLSDFQYGFNNKYYLSFSYRTDGSSKFGEDNRWGDFWSVGATWRLSEENFIKNLGWITNLKLRLSYGINGNDAIGNYQYQSFYDLDARYNNSMAAVLGQVGNTTLGWEGNKNFNVALEYKFFERVYGTLEFYDRRSDKLLLSKRLPYSVGADSRQENVGEIQNRGIEISLGAMVVAQKDFDWSTQLTLTNNKNEILSWSGDNWYGSGQTYRDEGLSMYNLRMKKWAGVDPNTGKPLWYKDITDADENSTGKHTLTDDWSDASMYDVGQSAPDIFGAWSNSFRYKNWHLSFQIYYSLGNKAYNNIKGMVNSDGAQPAFNLEKDAGSSWSKAGDKTDFPMYVTNDPSKAWYRSTRFLENGDFLKMKNITLGYDLPDNIAHRLRMSNVNIFMMAENVFTLTEFTGYDPELGLQGDTTGDIVPPATTVSFGINVSF